MSDVKCVPCEHEPMDLKPYGVLDCLIDLIPEKGGDPFKVDICKKCNLLYAYQIFDGKEEK